MFQRGPGVDLATDSTNCLLTPFTPSQTYMAVTMATLGDLTPLGPRQSLKIYTRVRVGVREPRFHWFLSTTSQLAATESPASISTFPHDVPSMMSSQGIDIIMSGMLHGDALVWRQNYDVMTT